MTREGHGLPRIRHFRFEKLVGALIDPVCDGVKKLGAPGELHPRPVAMKRGARRVHGRVDLFLARLGDARDEASVDRRAFIEGSSARRMHEGAVDEIRNLAHYYFMDLTIFLPVR